MTFFDLFGFLFTGFCSALGCGGGAGLSMIGLVIIGMFVLLAYKINLGFDGAIVLGGIVLIALSEGGFIFPWFKGLTLIGLGIVIGMGFYRAVRT